MDDVRIVKKATSCTSCKPGRQHRQRTVPGQRCKRARVGDAVSEEHEGPTIKLRIDVRSGKDEMSGLAVVVGSKET